MKDLEETVFVITGANVELTESIKVQKQMILHLQEDLDIQEESKSSNDEVQDDTPNDLENDLESRTCKECDFVASRNVNKKRLLVTKLPFQCKQAASSRGQEKVRKLSSPSPCLGRLPWPPDLAACLGRLENVFVILEWPLTSLQLTSRQDKHSP